MPTLGRIRAPLHIVEKWRARIMTKPLERFNAPMMGTIYGEIVNGGAAVSAVEVDGLMARLPGLP